MTGIPSKRRSGNRPSQDRTDTRDTRKTIGPFYNRENLRRNISTRPFSSENFFRRAEQKLCGYWIRLTVTLVRVTSLCYLDRRPLHEIDEIVYEYDKKTFSTIGIRCNIKSNFNRLFNIIRVQITVRIINFIYKN